MRARLIIPFTAITAAALIAAGCGEEETTKSDTTKSDAKSMTTGSTDAMAAAKSITDTAVATDSLSTLVTAVTAAGLAETLGGTDEYTVFAPDNAAFDKVDPATLQSLLKPAGKEQLTSILTYHVVPGTVMAADLTDGQQITTVNGEKLTVSIKDGTVKVGDATVTTPDVKASNGVVHVIDTVLMPPS